MNNGSHSDLIYQLVKMTGTKKYLELGVYDGETFSKIVPIVDLGVGVDIVDKRINVNGMFYLGTTTRFFGINTEKFDFIFIDASHNFNDVKIDFISSLDILEKGGILLLHDTDPEEERLLQEGYCSDCYKIIDFIKNNFPDLDCVTLPLNECGLTIVRRKKDFRVNSWL